MTTSLTNCVIRSDQFLSFRLPCHLLCNLVMGLPHERGSLDGDLQILFAISDPLHHHFPRQNLLIGGDSAFFTMTTSLPLPTSACSSRISTLEFCKSMVLTRKEFLSTCISLRLNRPSLMVDWTYRRKTLQSLVA
jgi:hypothetical protein